MSACVRLSTRERGDVGLRSKTETAEQHCPVSWAECRKPHSGGRSPVPSTLPHSALPRRTCRKVTCSKFKLGRASRQDSPPMVPEDGTCPSLELSFLPPASSRLRLYQRPRYCPLPDRRYRDDAGTACTEVSLPHARPPGCVRQDR